VLLSGCGPESVETHATQYARKQTSDAPELAFTDRGWVRGTLDPTHRVRRFLGIPYAKPPVDDRRWRKPTPSDPWRPEVLDATEPGPACAQRNLLEGLWSDAEDCLYLNVFAPLAAPDDARAVMVYFHGGGFIHGQGTSVDPTRLVAGGDVVVVTVNYRLGMLGFLAHPALAESAGGPSGNYGLMDQQEGLRWVKRNIRFFGGDPQRVTIFGYSAGSLSVHAHLVSDLSEGLFSRAIAQSGVVPSLPTLAQAEAEGARFAESAGCGNATDLAACLRSLTPDTILTVFGSTGWTSLPNLLIVDGHVVPSQIHDAYESGGFHRLPIMIGSTHDEFRTNVALEYDLSGRALPNTEPDYQAALATVLGPAAPLVASWYPLSSYEDNAKLALATAISDGAACLALHFDRLISRFADAPVFAYEFNDPNAPSILPPELIEIPLRAAHLSDLQYLFGDGASLEEEQRALSAAMIRYWTTFAKAGQPASPDEWPRYTAVGAHADEMLSLELPAPRLTGAFVADHQCDDRWAILAP
jgi:para-nitrobenzyl esterase